MINIRKQCFMEQKTKRKLTKHWHMTSKQRRINVDATL